MHQAKRYLTPIFITVALLGAAAFSQFGPFYSRAVVAADPEVYSVLRACKQGSDNAARSAKLAEMAFASGKLAKSSAADTLLPFFIEDCALRLGQEKIADYARFLAKDNIVKRFRYVSADTFFGRLAGKSVAVPPSLARLNWYSDYEAIFGAELPFLEGAPSVAAHRMFLLLRRLKSTLGLEEMGSLTVDYLTGPEYLNQAGKLWVTSSLARDTFQIR